LERGGGVETTAVAEGAASGAAVRGVPFGGDVVAMVDAMGEALEALVVGLALGAATLSTDDPLHPTPTKRTTTKAETSFIPCRLLHCERAVR
jgi:hypothetical protein